MDKRHFYLVIIGTEILNGRREDAHFRFVKELLLNYHTTLFATFIIEDEPTLIRNTFKLIKADPQSVLFSFGGIGSTPDDLTREIAAEVFTDHPLEQHPKFAQDIIDKFGDAAYPNRINMSMLPRHASLLFNPINNMSGFQLQNRFFFVPGFPEMSHPMIQQAVQEHFSSFLPLHRQTFTAQCSEDRLIQLMKELPPELSLSSLPQFVNKKPNVVLSLASTDLDLVQKHFERFIQYLNENNIEYFLGEA